MIKPTLPSAVIAQTKSSDKKAADQLVHPLLQSNEGSTKASFQEHLSEVANAQSANPSRSKKPIRPDLNPAPQAKAGKPAAMTAPAVTAAAPSKGLEKNLLPREAPVPKDKPALKATRIPGKATEAPEAPMTAHKTNKTGEELDAADRSPHKAPETPSKGRGPVLQKPITDVQEKAPAEIAALTATAVTEGTEGTEGIEETEATAVTESAQTLSPEEQQKRLEALMALLGTHMTLNDLPSIAMLTGRLDAVQPAAIPETMAGSALIQNLVASEDPAKLVDQVKPLGAWLQDMGWSPEGFAVKDPVAFQAMMETPVSLRDLMKTFNVDVDRVVHEARLMQVTLPMDGAVPYIERAQRMQGNKTPAPVENKDKPVAAMPFVMAAMGQALIQQSAAEAKSPNVVMPAEVLQSRPLDNAFNPENLWISTAELPAETMIPLSLAADLPKVSQQPLTLDQLAQPQIQPQSLPMMTNALPQQFTPNMLQQQDPISLMMQQNPGMMQAFTFATPVEAAVRSETQAPIARDLLQSLQAIQIQQDPKDPLGQNRLEGLDKLLTLAASPELVSELREALDSEESSDQSLGEGQAQQDQSAPMSQTQSQGPGKAFSLEGQPEIQKALPPTVMKEVFDKSSMLLQEGGGTMKIDLGSQEMGSLNLSVEVKDKTVEIKIVAANAQARELLATELPKLREALQNQNLDLKKVEIGLGGGSSYSQTSSDGRNSSRRDEYQSFEDSNTRGVGGATRSSRGYRSVQISSNSEEAPRVSHDGSIQVRV